MRSARAGAALLVAVAGLVPFSVRAQDPRLRGRLEAPTVDAVTRTVEHARAAGLPTEPLIQKALEGASKGAEGDVIARAVTQLADRLGAARAALGPSSEADLVAAATALQVGVPGEALRRLQAASEGEPLSLQLVVLADLVQHGVPPATASRVLEEMIGAGATPGEVTSFQRLVDQDIRAGAEPAAAAATRARGFLPEREPGSRTDARPVGIVP